MKRKGKTSRKRKKKRRFQVNPHYADIAEMMVWMKSNGYQRRVKLSPYYFASTGRGVICRQKRIETGQVIVSIPSDLLITKKTVFESDLPVDSKDLQSLTCIELLTVFLCWEKLKQRNSYWYYYLNSLPPKFDLPRHLPCDKVQALRPDSLSGLIKLEVERFEEAKHKILSVIKLADNHRDLLDWSWSAVNTRCISLGSPSDPDACAIAPFLDLLNHSCHAKSTAGFNETTKSFEIITMSLYRKNEQIFINYGSHCNRRLLVDYGFVLHNNPNDFIPLPLNLITRSVPIELKHRLEFFERNEHWKRLNLRVYREYFDWNLDVIIKLISLNSCADNEWSIKSMIYSDLILDRHEIENYKFHKNNLIQNLLSEYPEAIAMFGPVIELLFVEEINMLMAHLT